MRGRLPHIHATGFLYIIQLEMTMDVVKIQVREGCLDCNHKLLFKHALQHVILFVVWNRI